MYMCVFVHVCVCLYMCVLYMYVYVMYACEDMMMCWTVFACQLTYLLLATTESVPLEELYGLALRTRYPSSAPAIQGEKFVSPVVMQQDWDRSLLYPRNLHACRLQLKEEQAAKIAETVAAVEEGQQLPTAPTFEFPYPHPMMSTIITAPLTPVADDSGKKSEKIQLFFMDDEEA